MRPAGIPRLREDGVTSPRIRFTPGAKLTLITGTRTGHPRPAKDGFTDQSDHLPLHGWVLIRGDCARITAAAVADAARMDDRATARLLSQHFTRADVAEHFCDAFVRRYPPEGYQFIEPSAGAGAFLEVMPAGSVGVDRAPRRADIWEADFLRIEMCSDRPIAFLGNPPFGRNSNLAAAFLNKAAEQAAVVGFILPRTARKASFQNKIVRNFHLVYEEPVPADAFLFCGRRFDVPAVFQIWERQAWQRELIIVETVHPDFDILDDAEGAEFAVRRVGGRAGVVLDDLKGSWKSHHFIKANVSGVKEIMIALEHEFRKVAGDVAGNPSLARSEMVRLYRAEVERRRMSAIARNTMGQVGDRPIDSHRERARRSRNGGTSDAR